MMLSVFSCTYWPFISTGRKSFQIYMIGKYFFPLCGLSFYFPGSVLWNKNFKIFAKSNLSIFQSLNKVRRTALEGDVIWRIRTHKGPGGHPCMRVAELWVFETKMGERDPCMGAGMGSQNLNELWAHTAGGSVQVRAQMEWEGFHTVGGVAWPRVLGSKCIEKGFCTGKKTAEMIVLRRNDQILGIMRARFLTIGERIKLY